MFHCTCTFLLVIAGCWANLHQSHRIEEWIEKPTKEIKSCLSPDLEYEEHETCRFFAAVVDAGSTGSRLHLFEFSHDPTDLHSPFKLESETFKQTTPGLSAYAAEPSKAADSVLRLIEEARYRVPAELWPHTPIVVKATAGLRLLPARQAERILLAVEAGVAKSGLLIEPESVGVLSGTDEGVFGWFTLNHLVNALRFLRTDVRKTAVALDLGGGSTQATFAPTDPDQIFDESTPIQEFGHKIKVFGQKVQLYTHSYLGNGLIAARLGISQLRSADHSQTDLKSPCMPPSYTLNNWDYAGKNWSLSGVAESSFEECARAARQFVGLSQVRRIGGQVKERPIHVFAYFFDRAEQAGLLHGPPRPLKLADYRRAARDACATPPQRWGAEHWRPWQCTDLTYIYTLLREGYGLEDDTDLLATKKLQAMEVSWALGAGYHLLNSYHESARQISSATNSLLKRASNSTHSPTYLGRIFRYLSDTATDLLVVLRIIS